LFVILAQAGIQKNPLPPAGEGGRASARPGEGDRSESRKQRAEGRGQLEVGSKNVLTDGSQNTEPRRQTSDFDSPSPG
ncbi:MAG: hypothetical protein NZ602_14095, partial [Thermoguttaceae bacterium]|nr:hypothetical protein [Thermoguttaceae bacterium]